MIILKRTCYACPEQYDAYLDEKQVGYLRLRHGYFTVEHPDCGGELIYEACPDGDGIFEPEERDYYLKCAVKAIQDRINNGPKPVGKPPAPDVEYEVVE